MYFILGFLAGSGVVLYWTILSKKWGTHIDLAKTLIVCIVGKVLSDSGMGGSLYVKEWYDGDVLMEYLLALYLMPQVVKTLRSKPADRPLDKKYLVALTLRRFLMPLYERGYSDNIFGLQPDAVFVGSWCLLFGLQLAVIVLFNCERLRALWVRLRQHRYDHVYKAVLGKGESCPVCLLQLSEDPASKAAGGSVGSAALEEKYNLSDGDMLGPSKNSEALKLVECHVARTPCKHMYHWSCFRQMVAVKLECAMCKAKLPPLNM